MRKVGNIVWGGVFFFFQMAMEHGGVFWGWQTARKNDSVIYGTVIAYTYRIEF
jgi:hypothetical protein